MRFQKPLHGQQHKSLMTFKTLLYKCYAQRGPIGAESKRQGARAPLECFSPLWTIWGPLALGFNNKYSNKIIAKALHLCTETYNNEQFSKFFLAEFQLKHAYFGSKSPKSPNARNSDPIPPYRFND